MARRNWDDLSSSYRQRLDRGGITRRAYESGGSLSVARGHGRTPEHPERASEERYREYFSNRTQQIERLDSLKEYWYGGYANWNPEQAHRNTIKGTVRQITKAADWIERWQDDETDFDWEDIPDDIKGIIGYN